MSIMQADVKRPGVHQGIKSCLEKPVVHRLLLETEKTTFKISRGELKKDYACRTIIEPERESLIGLIK